MEIKGSGLVTISGSITEPWGIRRFDKPKQLQKLTGLAIMADSSRKYNGESRSKSQPYGLTTGSAGGLDKPLQGIFRCRL